jgi:hypothetical protein
MNTPPDTFEDDLRALQRRDLPGHWRDEILHAAQTAPRVTRTPRWLVAGWSLAWAAILMMYFTTPAVPELPTTAAPAAPALLWADRAALIQDLLAAN